MVPGIFLHYNTIIVVFYQSVRSGSIVPVMHILHDMGVGWFQLLWHYEPFISFHRARDIIMRLLVLILLGLFFALAKINYRVLQKDLPIENVHILKSLL